MWVGKFALLSTGYPEWIDNGTTAVTGAAFLNGAAYDPQFDALYVTTEAVAAADAFIGGFRYRSDGALRVYDATSAVPAGANTNQGIALTNNGQLCYTTTAGTTFNLNGVAVDTLRRVYAAPLSFALEFADLGAGVVSTVEAIAARTPTFTRATAATTVLSTGLIGSVASGDPRSYYDPTTRTYLGYLAEGARTNLCLQSEDLATTWLNSATSESTNATIAPDGATTADKLIEDVDVATTHFLQQDFASFANAIHTVSVFAKAGERTAFQLVLNDSSTNHTANFNLATGSVGSTSNCTSTIKSYPNGWYRCTLTSNAALAVAVGYILIVLQNPAGTSSYDGDGTSGAYFWGAQLEAASFASSYIPTTTAAVTRNADVLTYPTTGWINASAGTLYAEGQRFSISAIGSIFTIDAGDANNQVNVFSDATTGAGRFQVNAGGSTVADITVGTLAAGLTGRYIAVYALNDVIGALNGTLSSGDTSAALPISMTTATIGRNGATGIFPFDGPIRRVAYYSVRLPNAELVALTSG